MSIIKLFNSLKFFTNPATSTFTISEMSYSTIVCSVTGQKVLTFENKKDVFDVASLPRGLYFVQFELENKKNATKSSVKN
jgi:hypothetical protein